ncbi:MBL fold metallo-hydrolase [Herbaspirillum autotrophicum]|uniref:MBL fold metallo-hydrolase n=1 Tax=Herbaspirillum autotrophicum TaxID=180195 RepID=UPI0009FB5961|nr:MBL fold metallo-hydrolase [Herbaspirillum autotrophicum]
MNTLIRSLLFTMAVAGVISAAPASAATPASAPALTLDVYNPGDSAIFPVSSVLVSGQHDAILVDAQFGRTQAAQVVEKIRASGKKLVAIYISHGDPDYYFGLATIKAAYPDVPVWATPQTVAHIKETMQAKLGFWGPQLAADKPETLIVPEVLQGDRLTLEGKTLNVMGLKGPQPDRSFVWIPSIKAVVGGVVVAGNLHVWMADTQTAQSHQDWLATLAQIEHLHPKTVVPGHFAAGTPMTVAAVKYTRDYIKAFDAETARAANSAELIAAMKKRFPAAHEESSLNLSAKIAKGEMKW